MIPDRVGKSVTYLSLLVFNASILGAGYLIVKEVGIGTDLLLVCGTIIMLFSIGLFSERMVGVLNTRWRRRDETNDLGEQQLASGSQNVSSKRQKQGPPEWLTTPRRSEGFGSGFPLLPGEGSDDRAKLQAVQRAAAVIAEQADEIIRIVGDARQKGHEED